MAIYSNEILLNSIQNLTKYVQNTTFICPLEKVKENIILPKWCKFRQMWSQCRKVLWSSFFSNIRINCHGPIHRLTHQIILEEHIKCCKAVGPDVGCSSVHSATAEQCYFSKADAYNSQRGLVLAMLKKWSDVSSNGIQS